MVVTLDSRWKGKVVVVTGASSGIGEAIAERLVEEGMKVVALARRKDRLETLAKRVSSKKGKLFPLQVDMSKEEQILNAFTWIKENLGPLHVLVNNAGIAKLGLFTESDTKSWTDVLKVNLIALSIASREAVKSIKENNVEGHIININSALGHEVPNIQFSNMYSPSKHAVRAVGEVLRNELAYLEKKIKVTTLSPGVTRTEMIDYIRKNIDEVDKVGNEVGMLEPQNIAEAVVFVISTPPTMQVTEMIIKPLGESM